MANTNSNPVEGRTGGPTASTTGPQTPKERLDSQKGSAANPTGRKVPEENQAPGAKGAPAS